jgi:glycerophosphoryl diester phosphodiesterase
MNRCRRAWGPVIAGLALCLVALMAAPADAARTNLHRGSRGGSVQLLEARLAQLYFLSPHAVDRRYQAATVQAVRQFQWRLGLQVTGRVNGYTWNLVAAEAGRRSRLPAPTILGHRGEVTTRTGENTLGAMRLSAPHVRMLEFDVRVTADHELVLMHDQSLDRTTNCTGLVSSWTSAALREQCRVGVQVIPTLDEVAEYAASSGRAVAPDLKDATMSSGDLAEVVRVIRSHGLAGRTWVQSVYGSRFAALRQREPRLRTVLVSRGTPSPGVVSGMGAAAVATPVSALTIPRVRAYHAAGVRVWGWTARTTADLQMARAMRADAVVADSPVAARSVYRRS